MLSPPADSLAFTTMPRGLQDFTILLHFFSSCHRNPTQMLPCSRRSFPSGVCRKQLFDQSISPFPPFCVFFFIWAALSLLYSSFLGTFFVFQTGRPAIFPLFFQANPPSRIWACMNFSMSGLLFFSPRLPLHTLTS